MVAASSSGYSSNRSSGRKMAAKELQRGASRSSCKEERQLRRKNSARWERLRLCQTEGCEELEL